MNTVAEIGHNQPPTDAEAIQARLAGAYEADIAKARKSLEEAQAFPETIEDEASLQAAQVLMKEVRGHESFLEGLRKKEKEPYDAAGGAVHAFFKTRIDRLNKARGEVNKKATAYLSWKVEQERLAREEEERKRREEEERQRREAEEARLAAEAAAKAAQTDAELEAAIAAEQAAKEREAEADRAAKETARARLDTMASTSAMARTRTAAGTVSLRTEWGFEGLDPARVDLEALRPYLPLTGIEQAIRAFIRDGGRDLRGCQIVKRTVARV